MVLLLAARKRYPRPAASHLVYVVMI